MNKLAISILLFILSTGFNLGLANPLEAKEKGTNHLSHKYGEVTELLIGEHIYYGDDFSIKLTSFSHKRPKLGGPTKATAYLTLSKDDKADEITLSVHGVEGKDNSEDGLIELKRYDRLQWGPYEFQLKGLNYDRSIEILVNRKNE
jgi:hypothetical protein